MQKSQLPRAVLAAAALGCLATPAIAAGSSRTIRYRASLDLVTLDTVATISTPAFEAACLIYDSLFGLDDTLTPRPQMVGQTETADNGLTWRFMLRENLWFHDGEPVRAQDAVASIARWASRDRVGRVLQSRLAGIRALDDRSFQLRLGRPFPRMLSALATTNLFVMPKRIAAHTPAATPVTDFTGSGPFIFLPGEWVSGAHAAFRRNPAYHPRPEPPSLLSGGKVAHVDRVEWTTIPDTATATAALLNDEVDFIHVVPADVLPLLRRNRNIVIQRLNAFGNTAELCFDTIIPPLDDPALRRAMLLAVNQEDCVRAVVGDDSTLMRTGVGLFGPGTPLANDAGLKLLTSPRDLQNARQAIRDTGYHGQRIAVMIPTDSPNLLAFGNVIFQSLKDAGLNVDYQAMDWGTVVSRRNQVESGIWNAYASINPGQYNTPATHYFLSGSFYQDKDLEVLRDAWYDAPDLASERRAAEQSSAATSKTRRPCRSASTTRNPPTVPASPISFLPLCPVLECEKGLTISRPSAMNSRSAGFCTTVASTGWRYAHRPAKEPKVIVWKNWRIGGIGSPTPGARPSATRQSHGGGR